MGLDQYAIYEDNAGNREQFHYWRKHANLQNWMEILYRSKGGEGEFNCVPVEVTADDLDDLEAHYKNLPHGQGFFWGSSYPEHDEQTKEFIDAARAHLSEGKRVFYDSWW